LAPNTRNSGRGGARLTPNVRNGGRGRGQFGGGVRRAARRLLGLQLTEMSS
jgi:hypothetical protein